MANDREANRELVEDAREARDKVLNPGRYNLNVCSGFDAWRKFWSQNDLDLINALEESEKERERLQNKNAELLEKWKRHEELLLEIYNKLKPDIWRWDDESPDLDDLFGISPGCTGNKSSEEFVRDLRNEWDESRYPEHDRGEHE